MAIALPPSHRLSLALSLSAPSLYPPPSIICSLGCGLVAAGFGGCQMSVESRGAWGHEGPPCQGCSQCPLWYRDREGWG